MRKPPFNLQITYAHPRHHFALQQELQNVKDAVLSKGVVKNGVCCQNSTDRCSGTLRVLVSLNVSFAVVVTVTASTEGAT